MSTNESSAENGTAEVQPQPRFALNEDWVATIVGLLLLVLVLVLTGVIPAGLVP